jgi:hypothetical protein
MCYCINARYAPVCAIDEQLFFALELKDENSGGENLVNP